MHCSPQQLLPHHSTRDLLPVLSCLPNQPIILAWRQVPVGAEDEPAGAEEEQQAEVDEELAEYVDEQSAPAPAPVEDEEQKDEL